VVEGFISLYSALCPPFYKQILSIGLSGTPARDPLFPLMQLVFSIKSRASGWTSFRRTGIEGSTFASRLRGGRIPFEVRRHYANFSHRAQSWKAPRRVVAKVEWHPGELYPRVCFIVTNLPRPAERVVGFYNQRGTCEQWIKEGKNALKWTRLPASKNPRKELPSTWTEGRLGDVG